MHLIKALRIVLIALSISAVGQVNLRAGSYTYTALGGVGLSLETFPGPVFTPIPPPNHIVDSMSYNPTTGPPGPMSTVGDTTTYTMPGFNYFGSVDGVGAPAWQGGFVSPGGVGNGMVQITAPSAGGGSDSISFFGRGAIDLPGLSITIFAPNGTLSTSTELPATLDAFLSGGNFFLNWNVGQHGNGPFLSGQTQGTFVPEPSTFVLLLIGTAPVAIVMVARRARHALSRHGVTNG